MLSILLAPFAAGAAESPREPAQPFAIPTFHCLGLYWSPPGGTADKKVLVRYRARGASEWHEALSMRYNPIPGTEEDLTDYRGSIVHLSPATTYEVELTLAGSDTKARLTATTWSENFPVGETVRVPGGDQPLAITQSGSPGAYRVYDGRGATIDVRHKHDVCITINASHVIVRGFTLKGAGAADNVSSSATNAIVIAGGEDIVIEDCDISDWGRLNPKTGFGFNMESAISSRSAAVKRLVIQRCKLHDPAFDGSNWSEPKYPTHSAGPQAISLYNTAGNHVIRYNECTSDMEHMYNDIIGGSSNGSFKGAPGPDSDVYGNIVSHCWDDGLEIEGGNRNTRVWNNYIAQTMMGIGNAATSIGPLYLWRNIVVRSQARPEAGGGNFVKMGFAGGEEWMTGHMYLFHNTVFRGDGWLPTGGLGGTRIVKHTVSRNNILHVREPQNHSLSNNRANIDDSYDYDLFNGQCPAGQEEHGVRGEPVYADGAGFDAATKFGRFQLAPNSPGAAAGEWIPNFSGGTRGQQPDIGAHQRGAPPLRFGVGAK
ncbi:MAG: right-handed parallel beta-helix repeat-containing protein [Opitutaceae bacterium]|nr:right-handed parallel beta-helix repeat-containing protein [Opitutaceae bacterium]